MEYLPLYTSEQMRRHEVKPGITGLAQVRINAISWKEKFELDLWYVDNQSLWVDMRILVKTVSSCTPKRRYNWRRCGDDDTI